MGRRGCEPEGALGGVCGVNLNNQESAGRRTEVSLDNEIERGVLSSIFRRSMFWTPERQATSAWIEHVPFAFWLVDVLRPRTIVELGTQNGVSYSAMCQGVKTLGLATSCFAIDTWKGDEHAGFYSEDVYRNFEAFHGPRYSAFSQLIRSSFDEAVHYFEEGSIDLLHIDGMHSYECVKHDYRSWLPKLSTNAIVLFHDTNVREKRFGVFRFWSEITAERLHFNFIHGHGLGVLGLGCNYSGALRILFDAEKDNLLLSSIRETFASLGRSVRALIEKSAVDQSLSERSSEIGALRQALAAREDEVAEIRDRVDSRSSEIGALRQALAAREDEIAEIRNQVAAIKRGVAVLKRGLAKRQVRIAALDRSLSKRSNEIDELRQALAVREAKIGSLDSILSALYASTSWRFSAPLRSAKRLLVHARYSAAGYALGQGWQALRACSLAPLRNWRATRIIARSHMFDREWYLNNNPDVRAWGIEPIRHYVAFGARERRDPSPSFSTADYLANNPDVAAAGVNALAHFIVHGAAERRAHASQQKLASAYQPKPASPRRILVVDYRIPRSDISAGELVTARILRDLRELGYEAVFLPNDLEPSPKYEMELLALGVQVITNKQGYVSPAQYVSSHGHEFSAFYLFRENVAESVLSVIREVAPAARVIFHAPDLYSLREARQAELENSDRAKAQQTRQRELAVMRQVHHVVVQSPVELSILRAELPETPISVFPALYAWVEARPAAYSARSNVFFLGGFGHSPNTSAVQWFVKEVWPLVRRQLPDVEFHIMGSNAPPSVLKLGDVPGVKVVGFVPDLKPLLSKMRVGVAPLLFGAGVKGKVAMTMGAGIPCVCTDIAAEGMYVRDHVHTLVANESHAFADAVVSLYNDEALWNRLSQNGQQLITRTFSEAANRSSLLSVLDAARILPISLFSDYCKALAPRPMPLLEPQAVVDVSIIISVYNHWPLTRACVNSILETSLCDGICCEFILADDGSSDETAQAAQLYPGLKVVRTERNVGFLRNCNNAARHARGRHILFLNNDTVVLPGWLVHLYRTLEDDECVAIAGSKLLYPDGLIQEAGAVLFNDGTAHNVARGYDRDTPVFNIERETDYISGASILVRKSFWDAVGGFDERYKHAYCEDCDLAMAARSRGLRVVYQPASEVVHFEHQTYADQAPSHDASLQRHNTRLLLEKWYDTFQRDHCPAGPWQQAASRAERTVPRSALARRRAGRLSILYFSPFPSHPQSHGNRAIINQFARRFQEMGHTVHFVLLQSNEYNLSDLQDMREAWDTLDVLPYTNPMLADGDPIPFDGWYEDGLGERVRCLCKRYDIDMVLCSYVFQSKLLEFVPSYILKVIDTHDKMGDRYEMLRKNGQPLEFFSCTPHEEGEYLRRADIVVALREEEARYFDSVTGQHTAVVIPHVEAPRFLSKTFEQMNKVGIVASANQINLTLVRECLEGIDRRLAGVACPFTVHVAGQVKEMVDRSSKRENNIFQRPWVSMRGFVKDIGRFYADMDLILSPVTMGTGINVKTVEAMAYGMPLLTTSWGSKGIETGDPMHCHADLDALTESLMTILKNPSALTRLAALSRERYDRFYEAGMSAMRSLFRHQKLLSPTPTEPNTSGADGLGLQVVNRPTRPDMVVC
jgi:GT2 family glycosyltransferase